MDSNETRKGRKRFPEILFQILNDAEMKNFDWIISWLPDGDGFKVHDKEAFVEETLPIYYGMTKYKSFIRQLGLYEFQRIKNGVVISDTTTTNTQKKLSVGHPQLAVGG